MIYSHTRLFYFCVSFIFITTPSTRLGIEWRRGLWSSELRWPDHLVWGGPLSYIVWWLCSPMFGGPPSRIV